MKSLQGRETWGPEDCDKIIDLIREELTSARGKHPLWPHDIFHALAVIGEEFGEAQQSALDWQFRGGSFRDLNNINAELIQTAAMCIRTLLNLRKPPAEVEQAK